MSNGHWILNNEAKTASRQQSAVNWFRKLGWIDRLFLLLMALVFCGVFYLLFPSLANSILKKRLIPEFEIQHEKWQDQHITHYRATIRVIHPMMILCPTARVEVLHNRVIYIDPIEESDHITQQSLSEFCSSYYPSIDDQFDLAAENIYELRDFAKGTSVTIQYDERYGFPTRLIITNPSMGDMPNISTSDFEVLDDE